MFGDQTPSNIVWWTNMLMLNQVAKRLKHVWSNTDETIDTSRWANVVRMRALNMFDTRLSKQTKHRPSNTRTKEMFYGFDQMFDGLQILSNTTKYDQTRTRSNTIQQHQTKCPNGKMFGHQTMFDGVWSPNIYLLSRPLRFCSNVWWPSHLSNTTKYDQTRSNSTRQGVQTAKCLFTKQCLTGVWSPNISRLSRP